MQTQLSNISAAELTKMLRRELKNVHQPEEAVTAEMSQFRVFKQQLETLSQPNAPFARRSAVNAILNKAIENIYKESKESAQLLRKRYIERVTIPDVADHFHISQATVSRWTDRAFAIMVTKFLELEHEANESWVNRLSARLPSKYYDRLMGVDKLRDRLNDKLLDPAGPTVIALSGIGGIGKSSLADYLARKALRSGQFQQVAWVTFRPDADALLLAGDHAAQQAVDLLVPAIAPAASLQSAARQAERLADRFKSESHLVIIDNLEEQEQTDDLIRFLTGLGDPSRFIVTTRAQPARGSCHVVNLSELSRDHSLTLMEHYLVSTGQTQIGEVEEATLDRIFQIVGGNPLALKITAGLMQWMPLEKILGDLEKGGGDAANIYQKVFRNTWETLMPESQLLLRAMPQVTHADGATASNMQAVSGLAEESFWRAVNELIVRSMLEVRGTLNDRRYGLHRLTESFIEAEL